MTGQLRSVAVAAAVLSCVALAHGQEKGAGGEEGRVAIHHKPPIIISNGSCEVLTEKPVQAPTSGSGRFKSKTGYSRVDTVKVLNSDGGILFSGEETGLVVQLWLTNNADVALAKGDFDTSTAFIDKGKRGKRYLQTCGPDDSEFARVEIRDKDGNRLALIKSNDAREVRIDRILVWAN